VPCEQLLMIIFKSDISLISYYMQGSVDVFEKKKESSPAVYHCHYVGQGVQRLLEE